MGVLDAEDCINAPYKSHMKESNAPKLHSKYYDTPAYMNALSGEHVGWCYKEMYKFNSDSCNK